MRCWGELKSFFLKEVKVRTSHACNFQDMRYESQRGLQLVEKLFVCFVSFFVFFLLHSEDSSEVLLRGNYVHFWNKSSCCCSDNPAFSLVCKLPVLQKITRVTL